MPPAHPHGKRAVSVGNATRCRYPLTEELHVQDIGYDFWAVFRVSKLLYSIRLTHCFHQVHSISVELCHVEDWGSMQMQLLTG